MISELKRAFEIGVYIFIPFIVIDMLVASALMAMGMIMLPPVMISLPFKLVLFILVDGWNLLIHELVRSFG
jgi:flagellar biosynthetic protein FliP